MRPLVLALLLAATPVFAQEDLSGEPAPAGAYQLDPAHARLLFRVNHVGFSHYTALINKFDAKLNFDPENPEAMSVTATADPASVETHYPDASFDFNAFIEGPDFLDAAKFPEAKFVSTSVKLTGEKTADVTGDLTLHGVTHPITFAVTFNGGYGGHPLDVGARIGFSATTTFNRTDFGISFGLPPEGTTMGVFDAVDLILEAEFVKPRE
ncbi:MAG: polyisoprenoid-binding protein [Cereibacter sphaeroides]|uniref:Polyisoprenoid-binding protein n=1 Tax=Cereibacter sphaeroides TaxID=1063 RepID=A0A2W5UF07_CERSP|nr:MAG: polyisoprenoid-binding protein [Cereibacter sphaeroides]